MNSVAHIIDGLFTKLTPALMALLLIVCLVGLVTHVRAYLRRPPGLPRPIMPAFIASVIVGFGIVGFVILPNMIVKSAAWNEITDTLSGRIEELDIDGAGLNDASHIVDALREMQAATYHHSKPTVAFLLSLRTSRGILHLNLRRDSQDPHEYWVFYPNYILTRSNNIGRIFTTALDQVG